MTDRVDIRRVYRATRRVQRWRRRRAAGATPVRDRGRSPLPRRDRGRYFASQALTLPGFAFTHASAALSGFIFLPAIRFATVFWSFDVHLNFLTPQTAGEPLFANLPLMILSSRYDGYSHAYFFGSPPFFSSSWQPLKRGGSLHLHEVVLRVQVLRVVPVEEHRLLLLVQLAPARDLGRLRARDDVLEVEAEPLRSASCPSGRRTGRRRGTSPASPTRAT